MPPSAKVPPLLSKLWEKANFKPNDNQRNAILHVNGPLFLPAGPGSGKTRVLLWRAVNLIANHNIAPDEIFLSTFTEKAALQLRDGLRALLGSVTEHTGNQYDISRMYVGTVHSLCRKMLSDRRLSKDRQRTKPPVMLDELGQYLYIRKKARWTAMLGAAGLHSQGNEIINGCFNEKGVSIHKAIPNLISFYNRLSEEIIIPGKALKTVRNAELKLLLRLYDAYLQHLADDDNVAFTDLSLLQQKAVELLTKNGNSGKIFKHIIVDEYQDTNTVQEKLFFLLAKSHGNICVVGDDDQALYRFRGATVENFVEFPSRCKKYLSIKPKTIMLNMNYRSRKHIVDFYGDFIRQPYCDWRKKSGRGSYRVENKQINAHRIDDKPAVVASTAGSPADVAAEIAQLVSKILKMGKVEDANQIAFLFPSLKSEQVKRMQEALAHEGLKVYAPRAGSFLDIPESIDLFGLFFHIFGKPEHIHQKFNEWVAKVHEEAKNLILKDARLRKYIEIRKEEADQVVKDYKVLENAVARSNWTWDQPYDPDIMLSVLASVKGLSARALSSIKSPYFNKLARERLKIKKPYLLKYAVTRASSLDWNVLDVFYQLCGFKHFKEMFDSAEQRSPDADEGPICNLGLISQYLARFIDDNSSMISGSFLATEGFRRAFTNYLYVLHRRGESEYEDSEDPFPKGRIPFITVHQSKGLEFPVVVIANPRKRDSKPHPMETMVQPLLNRKGEPLDRMAKFDVMRMFYVALSRAKDLLVIAHYQGPGQHLHEPFKELLNKVPKIPAFKVAGMPVSTAEDKDLPQTYSYTGDYLFYRKCPRQYMIFKKYGFVPSRSQTMLFGNLVHQTLEDLHQRLISGRSKV